MGARNGTLAVLVVLVAAAVAAGGVAGADEGTCSANGERKLCLEDVSVSTERIVVGESATLSVTVRNAGDVAANGTVVLKVAGPVNGTDTYALSEDRLEPGEEVEVTQRLDASTPGTHGLQVVLNDGAMTHRYDASEVRTLEVEERSAGLGGPIDAPEYALLALLGSLSVLGVVVYRNN
ncbi:hypothetical protein HUG10_01340 [Halorarum halophilum]|uniref:CARDB domain-containing protein n=1 Tax=Halorarum halophilum TaxID=2743090 RepID=A0A7D5GA91_9EURY|nr:CARDB domain-containing protein [Halobaculum halophilum]QLG26265.1 hypothetical protein HUG10_01340 [Halobaculum halophilum]